METHDAGGQLWEDAAGNVWLASTEPRSLARYYGIADRDKEVAAMSAGLAALARAATRQR